MSSETPLRVWVVMNEDGSLLEVIRAKDQPELYPILAGYTQNEHVAIPLKEWTALQAEVKAGRDALSWLRHAQPLEWHDPSEMEHRGRQHVVMPRPWPEGLPGHWVDVVGRAATKGGG